MITEKIKSVFIFKLEELLGIDLQSKGDRDLWLFMGRLFAFLAIFVFMVFGPFYRQVLGGNNDLFRRWTMFWGIGSGIADVTFFQRLNDGTEVSLDRYEVLGYKDPRQAPEFIWRIKDRKGIYAVSRELCVRLGPDADVRVISRIGSSKGWKPDQFGDKNICKEITSGTKPNYEEDGERGH